MSTSDPRSTGEQRQSRAMGFFIGAVVAAVLVVVGFVGHFLYQAYRFFNG